MRAVLYTSAFARLSLRRWLTVFVGICRQLFQLTVTCQLFLNVQATVNAAITAGLLQHG